jgi:eukaryotic-like serine/threonine-protein kinase
LLAGAAGDNRRMLIRREPPPEPGSDAATERLPRVEERYGYVDEPVVAEEIVEEAPPPPRPPTLWPYLLALLLLVLGGLGALWYFTQDDEAETKPVPGVVRLAEGDAVDRLRDDGFTVTIERARSDDAPQGIVFAQRPGAGRELETGAIVTILVSRGPATTEVPDVTGLPADRAEELLRAAELRVNRAPVFSEEPPGTVVAQSPPAGERAARDAAVRINVSRGTGRVRVPDVVGRTADEAGAILRRAGLPTPNVVRIPSDAPEGEVVAQSPTAGSEIARDDPVRINVSDGTGAATSSGETDLPHVPNVVGFGEAEAVQALEEAGFTVRVELRPTDDPTEDGTVIEQISPPGSDRATLVTIVVGDSTG